MVDLEHSGLIGGLEPAYLNRLLRLLDAWEAAANAELPGRGIKSLDLIFSTMHPRLLRSPPFYCCTPIIIFPRLARGTGYSTRFKSIILIRPLNAGSSVSCFDGGYTDHVEEREFSQQRRE
jgi:hypothetical protein